MVLKEHSVLFHPKKIHSQQAGVPLEMIGLVNFPTLLPLSLAAGMVTLAIGITGNIDSLFNGLKRPGLDH